MLYQIEKEKKKEYQIKRICRKCVGSFFNFFSKVKIVRPFFFFFHFDILVGIRIQTV